MHTCMHALGRIREEKRHIALCAHRFWREETDVSGVCICVWPLFSHLLNSPSDLLWEINTDETQEFCHYCCLFVVFAFQLSHPFSDAVGIQLFAWMQERERGKRGKKMARGKKNLIHFWKKNKNVIPPCYEKPAFQGRLTLRWEWRWFISITDDIAS